MKKYLSAIIVLLGTIAIKAQNVLYEKQDSIFIENVIKEIGSLGFADKGERTLAIADRFTGCSYIAGTLEHGNEEPLFISCDKLDCTTFMELVVAIGITLDKKQNRFVDVCNNLENIRYKNGVRNGYASRLHYISWWITDSAKQNLIEETTLCSLSRKCRLHLSFMSRHPQNYPLLREKEEIRREIETLETPFSNLQADYIPKDKLNLNQEELPIKNGDILALTTGIEGLDVTHVGFAFWQDGHLHLMHASGSKGEVIRDDKNLFDYMKNRKTQTGIRVFRLK